MSPPELNLARRLRLGDDSPPEVMRVLLSGTRVTSPDRNEFADQLASFANSRGGTLVMGVDDETHKVLGIPLDSLDAVEGWVREICNDSVKPSLHADILKLELSDASGTLVPVVRIEVPRGLFVHESPGGYFHRTVRSKREMAPDVLARLFHERSQGGMIRSRRIAGAPHRAGRSRFFPYSQVPAEGFSGERQRDSGTKAPPRGR